MFKTLYAKLSLAFSFLLVVVVVVYALVNLSVTQSHLDTINQTLNWDLASNLVAERNLVRDGKLDKVALKQTFHEYMQINPNIEIYLLDSSGQIVSFSAEPDKVVRQRVSLDPIRFFLGQTGKQPVLGDDPRSLDRQKAFSVAAIPSAGQAEAYLYVVLRGQAFDVVAGALRESYLLGLSLYAIGISLIVALAAGLVVFRMLTRRLRILTDSMESFRRSDFVADPNTASLSPKKNGDEIDRLAHTFSLMATKIANQIEELRSQDATRRDMIANISHDLRTPLASMNGYLETMKIKAADLGEAKTREYVEIALKHGQQLAVLVENLFELAKLEAVDEKLTKEPFSITDLVQDVIQKLGPQAETHKIDVAASIEPDVPLVHADLRLIERVLENILLNAIQHTPPGTQVRIDITHSDDVRVRIRDNGSGIEATEVSKIFDRFYQGKSGTNSHHAGLGLAIANRIMELHGRKIQVDSTAGVGTSFEVWLAAHSAAKLQTSAEPTSA